MTASACGASKEANAPGPGVPAAPDAAAANDLASSVATAGAAGGTFLCAPPKAAVDACASKAAGAACTLFKLPDGTTVEGVCRASLDGTSVACGPTLPAPPRELVEPCQGKSAGAACKAVGFGGQERDGACATALDGKTLVCGRAFTPPNEITDPCAGAAAGDRCSVKVAGAGYDGVCSLGPGGSGKLACTPAQALQPGVTAPCAGLAAGAACTVGKGGWALSGKCVAPSTGGDPLCLVDCEAMAGSFPGCPGSSSGGRPPGSSGGGMPDPSEFVAACKGLSEGATCAIGQGQWAMSGKCVKFPGVTDLVCGFGGSSGGFPGGSSGGGWPPGPPGGSSGGGWPPGPPGGSSGGGSSGGGSTSSSSSGGTPAGCVKGQTKGSDVAVIGESFIALSHGITQRIEGDARSAGSLGQGDHYVDESVSGTTLANDQIPGQYRRAVQKSGKIRYVLMDGGGNDCLINNDGDAALSAATALFQTMAQGGTEKVVYFFYPDPLGSQFASLKSCLDALRPRMKALCDGLASPRCTWLDLRPTWSGHPEYTSDGIHPTAAGSSVTGDAIWKVMQEACVAQ